MSNAKQVREMLKEHGISEEEYAKIVKKSGMSKEDYDDLALTYNAPKGITWKEVAKRYQEMHPDINLEEFLDRMMMKWEEGKIKDVQAFGREIEKKIKEYRIKVSPKTNKTYPSKQDFKIIEDLKPYFLDDLPLKHNVKSYFYELADKYGVSFDKIKKMASKHHYQNSEE